MVHIFSFVIRNIEHNHLLQITIKWTSEHKKANILVDQKDNLKHMEEQNMFTSRNTISQEAQISSAWVRQDFGNGEGVFWHSNQVFA